MENFGSTHTIRTTVFWSAAGAYDYAHKTARSSADLTAGYHTYGLLWKPNSLTWYLDGKVVDRYTGSHVPDQPMYLLANLAIDGKAPSREHLQHQLGRDLPIALRTLRGSPAAGAPRRGGATWPGSSTQSGAPARG